MLFPNIFSVALSGAVSLASMVSTLPADQKWDRSSVGVVDRFYNLVSHLWKSYR